MKEIAIMLTFLIMAVFVSGCVLQKDEETNNTEISDISEENENSTGNFTQSLALVECGNLCKDAIAQGLNISSGPCLSDNNKNWTVNEWVCDIAHSPRQPVDDLIENQCAAYINSEAHHFVEVGTNCTLIRTL
jgi:hypothetical protein